MTLEKIKLEFENLKNKIQNNDELNELRIKYLGKKGLVSSLMEELKKLSKEEKIERAKEINLIRDFLRENIEDLIIFYNEKKNNEKMENEKIDLSLPGYDFSLGSKHPLNIIKDELSSICLSMGFNIEEGPEVESDLYNFERLNLPKDHPARDMQDTFYIDINYLLRTHTSPVQARVMDQKPNQSIKIVCPGKVYRRDEDPTHSHQFMQFEGLVIDKNITFSDLKGTLNHLIKSIFGKDRKIRFRNSYFPFTEPSVEVDVSCFVCEGKGCSLCKHTGWIEVLGAGMVHPNVLEMSGFSKQYQGFAFGLGIDRIAMLKFNISDIRDLYTNDIRFLKQFKGVL